MAWDFGCGDVIAGIKIIHQIYLISCVQENRADVRYLNFVKEIHGFEELLNKLGTSFDNATKRYKNRGVFARDAYDPRSDDFEKERCQVVGDFRVTLEACRDLIESKNKLRSRAAHVGDTVMWHLTQQDQTIDDLRRRLHMHSTKIKLVVDRLSINLLTDLDAKVDGLLNVTQRNFDINLEIQSELRLFYKSWRGVLAGEEPLNAIGHEDTCFASPLIESRFLQNLRVYAPSNFGTELPLKEGFDALIIHFEQSFEGGDQTPEQYLCLLKIRWLIGQLRNSKNYMEACPGFYYKRAISQVEHDILLRVKGMGIIEYADETLNELPDTAFLIWQPPKQVENPYSDPTVARANEQLILRMQLTTTGINPPDLVTILRQSSERFRLVLETSAANGRSVTIPQTVFAQEDRLIPRYALPSMTMPCLELAIFSRNEETAYRFNTLEDLFLFQTALTGFDVSHSQSDITCQFSKGVKLDYCIGHVQLWQDPITLKSISDVSQPLSPIDTFSAQSNHSRRSSVAQSIGPTTTINWVNDGCQMDPIKLSSMVIFTKLGGKAKKQQFAIMSIELATDINIVPEKCDCHHAYDTCAYLCFERKNESKFPVRILYTKNDDLGYPDPNSFDLMPFSLGGLDKKLIINHTSYVLLKFRSLTEKKKFHHEINLRMEVRERQLAQQVIVEREFQYRANRLMRRRTSPTRGGSSSSGGYNTADISRRSTTSSSSSNKEVSPHTLSNIDHSSISVTPPTKEIGHEETFSNHQTRKEGPMSIAVRIAADDDIPSVGSVAIPQSGNAVSRYFGATRSLERKKFFRRVGAREPR